MDENGLRWKCCFEKEAKIVKEVKIMKQREKGEMAHDVSPVTMFLH